MRVLALALALTPFLMAAAGETLPGGGGGGGAAPPAAPPVAPLAGAPAPPAAPPGAPPPAGASDAEAERKRLLEAERATARAALLKKHGFDKDDDLQKALEELKGHRDAKLTAEQRTAKELEEARTAAAAGKVAGDALTQAIDELRAVLSDQQRAALEEACPAGTPPAEQLRVLRLIRKLGGAAAAPAGAPPPPAPPANAGGAGGGAPKPNGGETPYAQWQRMKGLGADIFYQTHKAAIEASRPA